MSTDRYPMNRTAKVEQKYTYAFEEGNAEMKYVLGGKGANLAEMTRLGLPVPPGFTVTGEACSQEVQTKCMQLEKITGRKLGDPEAPLLLHGQPGGARRPKGFGEVLNIGLNDATVQALAKHIGMRAAWSSYRRFIQMFSKVVLLIDGKIFEDSLAHVLQARGLHRTGALTAEDWQYVTLVFKQIVRKRTGSEFPKDLIEQILLAAEAGLTQFTAQGGEERRVMRPPTHHKSSTGNMSLGHSIPNVHKIILDTGRALLSNRGKFLDAAPGVIIDRGLLINALVVWLAWQRFVA